MDGVAGRWKPVQLLAVMQPVPNGPALFSFGKPPLGCRIDLQHIRQVAPIVAEVFAKGQLGGARKRGGFPGCACTGVGWRDGGLVWWGCAWLVSWM